VSGLRLRRVRRRSWWLTGVALVVAGLAVGVAVLADAPTWLLVAAAVMGAVVALFVEEWRARRSKVDEVAATIRRLSDGSDGALPKMKDVSPSRAGVNPARWEVDYVAREQEGRVSAALLQRRGVLIIGPSMAGKTMLALHVTRQCLPDHRLFKPKNGTSIRQLITEDVAPADVVVWLDDLQTFIGAGGLTAEDLDTFCRKRTVAVATIGSDSFAELQAAGQMKPVGLDVLDWFRVNCGLVWLTGWTDSEMERVERQLGPAVGAAAREYGLSAFVGGGPPALHKFQAGSSTCPAGYALVQAAADWRRVGMTSPITLVELAYVLPAYLDSRDHHEKVPAVRQKDLDWATELIDETVALMRPVGAGFRVLDYVVDHVTVTGSVVADELWDSAISHASPAESHTSRSARQGQDGLSQSR